MINKENKEKKTPVVAITQGDTNSISYEIIIKALSDQRIFDFLCPVVYGNSKLASFYRKTLNLQAFIFNLIKSSDMCNPKRANIINIVEKEIKVNLGKETNISGEMAFLSLYKAIDDVLNNKADILVTLPLHKKNIKNIFPEFTGHTEYLQSKFNVKEVLMIMLGKTLKIALATIHEPIWRVPSLIKKEKIFSKIYLFNQSLIQDFNILQPKIAVLGLNPHAGENGMFGNEETEEISPAIEMLNNHGVAAFGPFSADGFFGKFSHKEFDGVFAMYHDQALIPFKTLCFEEGVNYTAGLPIVRTSPAHGTAFDIAGKNMASAGSLKNALIIATEIFLNRKNYVEMHLNSLTTSFKDLT